MRIYIPAIMADLAAFVEKEEVLVRGGTAFALTPALREYYVAGDDEELEHIAFSDAARASLRILYGTPGRKRVVISADVPDKQVTLRPDLDRAVVRLDRETIPADSVAAIHVDLEMAEEAVVAAAELIHVAEMGDEDAEITVGNAEDYELAWYAPEEIGFLLELSQ
ncbi:MAG: hypothetical protein WAN89_02045 [Lawsonella sp.]|nr:hypothetical protein [Mycobacteriales bacterium]